MATENIKSTAVTNADASPASATKALIQHGRLRESVGLVEAAGGDAGSVYRACRVYSSWRVSQVYLQSDDLGTGITLNVGLYQTAANGGAAVDADFFASAVDAATAAVAKVDVTHESGVYTMDKIEMPLWEALGLSADPGRWYDLAATSVSAAATGTIRLDVRYVDGS